MKTQILEMQENVQAQKFSCNVELPSVEIKIGSIRISSSNTILQINLPQIVFNGQDIAKLKEDPVHHHLNDVLKKSNTNEVELYTVSSSSSKNSLSNVKDEEVIEEAGVCTSVDVDGLILNDLEPIEIVYINSPDNIHIRKKCNEAIWKQFESNLMEEVEKAGSFSTEPLKGEMVLCVKDGQCWRGVVKGKYPNGCFRMKLIDVGETVHNLGIDDLRQLSKNSKVKAAESLTETVGLANLEPCAGTAWSKVTIDMLRSKINTTTADIFIRRVDGNKSVDIILHKNEVDNPFDMMTTSAESISKFLINSGQARKKGTKPKLARMSPQFSESPPSPPLLSEVSIHDCDESPFSVPDSLPLVPDKQIFSGILTHVDSKAVVWVVLVDNKKKLQSIRSGCQDCKEIEQEVEQGCLYVTVNPLRGVKVRARLLKIFSGWCLCIDVDSGELFRCCKDQLHKISSQLMRIPPLAIPIKLYGVGRTKMEIDFSELEKELLSSSDRVTVSIMEKDLKQLPLPGYVWYNKEGEENSGNLAWFLLKKGYVRVCTTYKDWMNEFSDNGLEWLLDPFAPSLQLSSFPCPVPVEVGVWSMVSVEGLFYPLNRHGEEQDVNVNTKDGNLVGCKLLPFSSNKMNLIKKYKHTASLIDSLRVTEQQLINLVQTSITFEEHLNEAAKNAKVLEEPFLNQKVLAYFSCEDGSGVWSRGIVEFIPRNMNKVWVYFLDYGHRSLIDRDNIRELKGPLMVEPVYCSDVWFPMPGDNGQLRTIRKEIRDSGPGMFVFVRVDKIIPRGYPDTNEIQASFWKVFEDQESPGFHSIAKIC